MSIEEAKLVADTIRALQKHLQCVICFEILRDPMTTRCGHTFCQVCINRVAKEKNALCPLCNIRINRRGIVGNEKIRSVVQAVHMIICNAQKDISDMGYEDVLQGLKEDAHSTSKKSLSPIQHVNADLPSTSFDQKTVSRRSKKVESWLLDVHDPSPSQVFPPIQPVLENSTNEESDSEMPSVSQINPNDTSNRKPLSAYIEDDCEPPSNAKKPVIQKSKKPLVSKKIGQLNVIAKQESLKGFGTCKVTPSKSHPEIKVPDPVLVVLDLDKENSSDQLPVRSPGWSRFQKMKKDFQVSPVPSIEDPASSDEMPCINLSLDSPMLKKRDKINEIVNSLQSEIEICERSMLSTGKQIERNFSPSHSTSVKKCLAKHSSGFSNRQPIVKFLKLGRLSSRKSPSVPIYLKGPLEHLYCMDVSRIHYRMLLDAQTQTDPNVVESPKQVQNKCVNQDQSPLYVASSPVARRSLGAQSEVDMDAETILYTQHFVPAIGGNERAISPLSLPNEASTSMDMEIIECTYPQNNVQSQVSDALITSQDMASNLERRCMSRHEETKQSQFSDFICSSLDVRGSPKKTVDLETTNYIPQVDLDDSCSSEVLNRSTKRPRTLVSLSDSSDSDVGVSNKQRQKKRKSKVLSDNENSCSPPKIDDPDISSVDTEQIMANIEAKLAEEEKRQSINQVAEKKTDLESETFEECLDVLSNTSRNQVDSDGDSEVINPTPQKQTSFISRQITESSDIVPSSQPPGPMIPTHRSPPAFLTECHSTAVNSNDLQQNSLGNQENASEDVQEQKKTTSSEASVSEVISVSGEATVIAKLHTTGQALLSEEPPKPTSFTDVIEEETEFTNTNKTSKLQFVCSSLPAILVAQVEKLATSVKADFSSKFTCDTSHLIVRVDETNKADKTLKYLCAVAAGKWVVSFAWVEKCLAAGKLLPEEPFEALDTSGEPGPRRSREARLHKKNLFSGFEFCCIGDFPDISKDQMQALLIDCGASMVSQPDDFSFQDRIIPVALAQWDESKEAEYNSWLDTYSSPLVQHEWVLDCIGRFSLTSFSSMLLCDITEDYLSNMGIPAHLFELTDSEQ